MQLVEMAFKIIDQEGYENFSARKLAEVFFQLAPYGGMPLVNKALEVCREVLKGRGEWEAFTKSVK